MAQRQRTDWRARVQRLRVPLGFVTAILFVLTAQPTWRSLALGLPLALLGTGIRAWASGHLRKNAELATSGPYAHTRNPLYFGSFVMALGCAAGGGSGWFVLWLCGLFALIYVPVMQAEAAHMQTLFADAYARWAAQVPLFWPRLTPFAGAAAGASVAAAVPASAAGAGRGFAWQQYRHHREYRALLGVVIIFGLLALKAMWR